MELKDAIGDENSQVEGTWIPYPGFPGVEFKLAYSEHKAARDYQTTQFAKARQKSRKAVVSGEDQERIAMNMLVLFLVKGWKGITDEGQEYEFNQKNCRTFLEKSPSVRDWLADQSRNVENFGAKTEEVPADGSEDEQEEGGPKGPTKSDSRPA